MSGSALTASAPSHDVRGLAQPTTIETAVPAGCRDPQAPLPALAELTERECDILLLIARGLGNDEIAGRLVISPHTAKSHVRNILRKLDCHDRAGLVAIAYESRLITPGDHD